MRHLQLAVLLGTILATKALDEGSLCNNFDGTLGVCVVDRDCKWALDKLKKKEIKINQLIRCGLKGSSSVICCKDDSAAAAPLDMKAPDKFVWSSGPDPLAPKTSVSATKPPVVTPSSPPDTRRKSEKMCDLIKNLSVPDFDFHIVNGEGADVGEFPHMVAIGFPGDEFDDNILDYACGGSLITRDFVLTAGHCVNNRNRQPRSVKLGRVSLIPSEYDENPAQDIPIKKVHLHPSYSSRRKYNDIALLELTSKATLHKAVKPACLYSTSASFAPDAKLSISGWGRIDASTSEKSSWLQKADIYEVPLEECRKVYQEINLTQLPENLKISQLCATSTKDGKILDACQGDSGGPLQYKTLVKQETVYYIVGVTSFGASCGSEIPGVYTRVSEYRDWIESVVWSEGKVEL